MCLRWNVAVIAVAIFTATCSSSSGYCPGICPGESTFPTMSIAVDGGTASIASAEIISGPCTYLLTHSAGEAGAQPSYAGAQVTYNGPSETPPQCQIKLTSLDGEPIIVTASVTATSYQQPCCPYGRCCTQTSAITVHHRVVFDQPAQTISFPNPPAQDLDGGAVDAALDAKENLIDAGDRDSATDIPENPAEDATIDEATGEVTGSPSDAEQVLDLAGAF